MVMAESNNATWWRTSYVSLNLYNLVSNSFTSKYGDKSNRRNLKLIHFQQYFIITSNIQKHSDLLTEDVPRLFSLYISNFHPALKIIFLLFFFINFSPCL